MMKQIDVRSVVDELNACSNSRNLERGKNIHRAVIKDGNDSNVYFASALIKMYAKCGSMDDARLVFDSLKYPNVVCWNALICGYAENGEGNVCLELLSQMAHSDCSPNARTLAATLQGCANIAVEEGNRKPRRRGKKLHMLAVTFGYDSDIFVQGTLVEMYSKCRMIEEARKVFEGVKVLNEVIWTAMILGYVDNGDAEIGLDLFSRMNQEGCAPNARTFVAALKACADLQNFDKMASQRRGKELHLLALQSGCNSNAYVQGTLVDMYSKCGIIYEARRLFDRIKKPGVVAWTALILGYADNGESIKALDMFSRMKSEGCAPNEFTFSAVLKACGVLGALEIGKGIHANFDSHSLKKDILATCLVDFYARCGSLVEAQKAFDLYDRRNLVTWNALMTAYSHHGDTFAVLSLLERLQARGLQPDNVTFKCILTACGHAGLVDLGLDYFQLMSKYDIKPGIEHYNCLINILGRANKLDGAMVFLRGMHFSPTLVTWLTILEACRKWKNVDLGRIGFESLTCLDDGNSGAYLLMKNVYGPRGRKA